MHLHNEQQTMENWLSEYESLEPISAEENWEQQLFQKLKNSKREKSARFKLTIMIGAVLLINSFLFILQQRVSDTEAKRKELLRDISEQLFISSTAIK